jgi:hypothetical protein
LYARRRLSVLQRSDGSIRLLFYLFSLENFTYNRSARGDYRAAPVLTLLGKFVNISPGIFKNLFAVAAAAAKKILNSKRWVQQNADEQ